MILREYPEPSRLRDFCGDFNRENSIVHAVVHGSWYPRVTSRFSIKAVVRGREEYRIGRARHSVTESGFLVINAGQEYQTWIDSDRPVESFCVFFRPGFVEAVLGALDRTPASLLAEPPPLRAPGFSVVERVSPHEEEVSPLLRRLSSCTLRETPPAMWLDEQFHHLAEAVLRLHDRQRREMESLPAIRASTRAELYRRLHQARDFLDASYRESIGLDSLAEAVALSPYYLLRTFRAYFGCTPHQYLTSVRLARASDLLLKSRKPVIEICHDVGFHDQAAFSRLFSRSYRISPRAFRARQGG